jgi:FG-GAP repeat
MHRSIGQLQSAQGGEAAIHGRLWLPWRTLIAAAVVALAWVAVAHDNLGGGHAGEAPPAHAHGLARHQSLLTLPLTARGPVSAALGANARSYRVSATRGSLRAVNPAQRLRASFSSAGASVSADGTRVRMSLRGIGYGSSQTTVAAVAPSAHGNRVVYAHPGLSEWYDNGPLGLEQGFTLVRAPAGRRTGPLTLSIALSGNAPASLAGHSETVILSRAGKPTLRYAGLTAIDARGRLLHSWLQVQNGRLLLRVDARGARYPLRIDPFLQQGEELTGAGEIGEGKFGYSMALSENGNTALIGAPSDNGKLTRGIGAVWVFTRTGETWTQQGEKLTARGEVGEGDFGESVALSADGNTALIGAPQDEAGDGDTGAAWVFTRSGETWTQQGEKLTGAGEGYADFGKSVALSTNGDTALIGADANDQRVGAAWVFTRSGETWTQQGEKLTGSGEIGEGEFGRSVALSGDGNTALIGGSNGYGAAWVFTRSAETWTQQGKKLTGSGEVDAADFGESVALSYDGDSALIGGSRDDGAKGAVWAFTRSGETWTQNQKLTRPATEGEPKEPFFGEYVALSANGEVALIGGVRGGVWQFTRSGESWIQAGEPRTNPNGDLGPYGERVALSADGTTALLGTPNTEDYTGAALVFTQAASAAPGSTTGKPSSITRTTATLNATVNPNDSSVNDCKFEYGLTESYGSSVPCVALPGEGGNPVAVSASISGLIFEQTYHYRIYATNGVGTRYGGDKTFTTMQPATAAEYGQCRLLGKASTPKIKHGDYSEENCQTKDVSKKGKPKGEYEWYPGPASGCEAVKKGEYTETECLTKAAKRDKGKFERLACFSDPGGCAGVSSTSGEVALEAPSLDSDVVCSAGTGTGEITGTKTAQERIMLTGCESAGDQCTSEGTNSTPSGSGGVIVTNLLALKLVASDSGRLLTELVSAEHQPYLFEFGCQGRLYRTSGSPTVVPGGNVNVSSTTSTLTLTLDEGEQFLYTEVSEDGGTSWIGPDASTALFTLSNTAPAKTEIKTKT